MKKSVIIVAAGIGSRMNANIPKQFMELNGKPILMHTLHRFHDYDPGISIILVLSENEIETWNNLLKKYSFSIPHTIVKGGAKRFYSVRNGLDALKEPCIVAIHDGVRPFCSPVLINRCFNEAEKKSNAIPVIRIPESIREVAGEKNFIVDRENFRIIQTPQCFVSDLLKKAYQNIQAENFTDDAGVFEKNGNKISLIEGERNNIKITIQDDFLFASVLEKELFNLR